MVVTILVLFSAAFATSPVRDAVTLDAIPQVRLSLSAGYLAIAPLSAVLDTLTLLTVRQHIALLIWAILLYGIYRVWRGRSRETPMRRATYEVAYGAMFLVGVVVVYAMAALMPRPMAELAIADPDHDTILAVDFHSHTHFSHDGRRGWDSDDVRQWHRAAGFDAAYISDHSTFAGAERGVADDPAQAGEGTMLLQAVEVFYNCEHVNVLDAGRRYRGLLTKNQQDVDTATLALASAIPGLEPVIIETIPGNPSRITPAKGKGTAGARAIELVDGAPRGLQQTRHERARIVHLADSLNLALVAGSDNHGYGRAAPAWTLVAVPGWRGMTSDSLTWAIERNIRNDGRGASRVVERVVADPGTDPIALAFAPWIAAWRMLTTLSSDERVMWVIWAWLLAVAVLVVRRRRAAA